MTKRIQTKKLFLILVFIVGVVCLVAAGLGLRDYLRTIRQGESMPDTKILSASVDNPDEKNPGDVSNKYKVPADQPRVIDIPSLDASGYVQRVGINHKNVMIAPNNIFFAGWYTGSVAPGEKGVSIIDGHVRGKYSDGIFRHLTRLKKDDAIRIQMGDNTWREFIVEETNIYSAEDATEALFKDDPNIERELHLITCDGIFDKRTQTYDKRLIVTASLENNL